MIDLEPSSIHRETGQAWQLGSTHVTSEGDLPREEVGLSRGWSFGALVYLFEIEAVHVSLLLESDVR